MTSGKATRGGNMLFWGLLIVGIILAAVGGYGVLMRQTLGVVDWIWGLYVVAYVFFGLSAAGSELVAAVNKVFKVDERLSKYSRYIVYGALATLLPSFAAILTDLGALEHFTWIFLGFNPTSRIAWMGVFYTLLALGLLAELVLEMWGRSHGTGFLSFVIALGLLAIFTYTNLGAIFGASYGIPAWTGVMSAFWFPVAGLAVGISVQALILAISDKIVHGRVRPELVELVTTRHIRWATYAMLINGYLLLWYTAQAYYNPPVNFMLKEMTSGVLSPLFWTGLVLGFVIPLALGLYAAFRRSFALSMVTFVLYALGIALSITVFVAGGQLARIWMDAVLTSKFAEAPKLVDEFLSSMASEWQILAFNFGFWFILLALGVKLLALEEGEKPRRLFIFR